MKASKTKEIFEFLKLKNVPMQYSIPFCLRLRGIGISEMAARCGVSRGYFYQVISGARTINQQVKKELGGLGIEI